MSVHTSDLGIKNFTKHVLFKMTLMEKTFEEVQEYYGKVLKTKNDLKTSACCISKFMPNYLREAISNVPDPILAKFYGCDNPIPPGIKGLTVLDLGCGSGRDCYIAAQFVGDKGKVIGIDMTAEQLKVAEENVEVFGKTIGWAPKLEFKTGFIEFLNEAGIENSSIDIIISNCVINLSPKKDLVLKAAYNVLKEGGEIYFSDVYCDRRLSESVRQHKVLWGECIAGALYEQDFVDLVKEIGFKDPRVVSRREIQVAEEFKDVVGSARFYSITFRLFKLPSLERHCEDYGQFAVYNGQIVGHANGYQLDHDHFFEKGKPVLVCGNTASMVSESWLNPYFHVEGDTKTHYGSFQCSTASETGKGCC
jgi:arsenite methyltransferase